MDWITPVLHKNGPNASKCDRKDVHPRHHFIPFLVQQADRTFRTPSTSIRFLCIGKFIPRKRILELVRALGAQRSMRQYHLTIIGECSTPEHHQYEQGLNSEIAKQGLEPFVTIVKNLTRAEVSSHFSAADVFVLPSVREPASVSQLEAMAHGLPVICTSDNGTACYIEHGVTGYIVSPDEQSLTEALAKYLNDPGLARLHGDAVTSHFQSFFEPKLLLKSFLYACGDTSK
jgi:glycosyltransferase involved in cell wall biosynthesis